ncbi:hypothetical protein B0T25DRAFT_260704 [Lasiosphaeria hispida]|uniref:AHC1-like C2H2 zinc-finger domain-containing protein n=1 Tax=Lasiosphaeria hispida TaxID=260671 RepID=A0AAJ0HG25_9PEZI|nr:hypothetical protein B0T25DRAFT_260704 [Lasiosphaeria hispida]
MFRFWASDSRGSEKTADGSFSVPDCPEPIELGASYLPAPISRAPVPSPKRRRPSSVDTAGHLGSCPSAKRAKTAQDGGLPSPISASADGDEARMTAKPSTVVDLERAKDVIQYQFGLEILLKHDELRLINQEMAKCQVALEQLRRCHLIPYPAQCPTPSQMLDISSGKGPALQSRPGQPAPRWAPPFGVVEGPYARHYAKWLIPDPVFDGIQPESYGFAEASRAKNSVAEGRTTRNSMTDAGNSGKQRPIRGQSGQRLHALSSGYSQPKDKQAPCILKRSDGVTVKLVCIDCHRWDFSSTQGFINHCRIAHRRDFKSHEEAAVHSGHPIDVDETGGVAGDESKAAAPPAPAVAATAVAPYASTPGLIHPLARNEPVSVQEAYKALLSRIRASLDLYHAGKLLGVSSIPGAPVPEAASFVASSDTPYLSQLMQKKKRGGNLHDQVTDARTVVDWDLLSPGEDSDTDQPSISDSITSPKTTSMSAVRTPAVMRVPARSAASPPPSASASRPTSSKGRIPTHLELAPSTDSASPDFPETPLYEDDMDVDLSPNTITSNNAPSLVSDDGEYDDSDDGSASDSSDVETESVAEININEDNDVQDVTARPIHRSTGVKLKKEETRHVTFVTPIASSNAKGRRKQKI